jgi:hypothetical protein
MEVLTLSSATVSSVDVQTDRAYRPARNSARVWSDTNLARSEPARVSPARPGHQAVHRPKAWHDGLDPARSNFILFSLFLYKYIYYT